MLKKQGYSFFIAVPVTIANVLHPFLKTLPKEMAWQLFLLHSMVFRYLNSHIQKTDSGQAIQFQVKATPAVFAVNPTTGKAFPIAYGLTSETELRDNIYNIVKRYEGDKS